MAKVELPYVKRFKDRHGKVRHYFRRKGFPSMALPGLPGTREFADAYDAALARDKQSAGQAPKSGSVSALIIAYYQSPKFCVLEEQTQRTYRLMLDKFREEYGDLAARGLSTERLQRIIDKKKDTPAAAENLVKRLRSVYRYGRKRGLVSHDPTVDLEMPVNKSDGLRPWTEADIAAFRKRWPSGKPALALDLLLYTGQRRSDVIRMGRQHLRRNGAAIFVRQQKTGAELEIPLHKKLKATLDAQPQDNLNFLLTEYGKPFTSAGFGNWFGEKARAAGIRMGSGAHGLRKAAARRLAEAGCSAHQIAAITGHVTLKEVERYTKSADQALLAQAAMERLETEEEQGVSNPCVKPGANAL